MMISKEYIAGFLDGEGCFRISKTKHKGRVNPDYQPRTSITNTYMPVLVAIQEQYGGTIQHHSNGVNKRIHTLVLNSANALRLAADMLPLLIEKKEQAWLQLELSAHQRGGRKALTEEGLALREGFYLAARNAKGGRYASGR